MLHDSFLYLLGSLLQKASAFFLIPVVTTYLSTAEYGLTELASTVVNLLLVVSALGVPNGINKCYQKDCPDALSRKRLAGTALCFTLFAATAVILCGWAFEAPLSRLLFPAAEGLLIYRYTLAWLFLALISTIPLELLRTAGRSRAYLALGLAQLITQLLLTFYLVKFRGWGAPAILLGNCAGLFMVILVAGFMLSRQISWVLDRPLLAKLASFGLAMIPVFVSGWVMNMSDRFFLQSMLDLGTVGVYALGYKFGTLVNLVVAMPFQRAWTPIFFGIDGEEAARRTLSRVVTYLVAVLLLGSLAVSLAVPPFLRFTASPEFHSAALVVPLVCFAYVLGGVANCLGSGLVVSKRMRWIAVSAGFSAGVNLLLNALLIPRIGMYGAALATIIAFGAQLAGILISLSRCFPIRLEWARLSGLSVSALFPLLIAFILPTLPLGIDVALRIALLMSCPVLMLVFRLPRPAEVLAVRGQMTAWGLRSFRTRSTPEVPPAGPGETRL